ncbi:MULTISPECIES: hypothetical protein [Streptomyces]|uniref:Uncharacterized protein n=1 Tax=Streptomyces sp. 900129855 TaxID=3155129 RepID=A0ABV2ZLB5_9ACTN
MTTSYRSDHAADPELFERLMRERYGPLDKVMAERDRPSPTAPVRRPKMAPAHQSAPDSHTAEHVARLEDSVAQADSRSRAGQRTPPYPGAVWCYACESWCTPQGICGCNNR